MLDRVPDDIDKREGSLIYDALAPAAFELSLLYFELGYMMEDAFADTASRAYLIRRAAERGIFPDEATQAVLRGEFSPASIDMTGHRFSIPNSTVTYLVGEVISPGVYQVLCEVAGVTGNQYFGPIIPILHIQGLQTATLTELLIPAKDEQDTESLREEYMESFRSKAFGGNIRDYVGITNGLDGVGATKVTPIWDGGGTVKLTILDATFGKASDLLVDLVQQAIDPTGDAHGIGLAPIGHVVTVETAEELPVEISFELVLAGGVTWRSIETEAVRLLESYLLDLRKSWADSEAVVVRMTGIEVRLLSIPGVLDIHGTTINGRAENLTIGAYQIPMFGGVTAHV